MAVLQGLTFMLYLHAPGFVLSSLLQSRQLPIDLIVEEHTH